MKKVLMYANLKSGGIEAFLIAFMEYINSGQCELHFAVPYAEDHIEFYEDTVIKWGAKIHKLGGAYEEKSYTKKQFFLRRKRLAGLLKREQFDVVYFHVGGNGATVLLETRIAIAHKVPKVIVHAHTSEITKCYRAENTKYRNLLHNMLKRWWPKKRVIYLACSDLAAKWLFPRFSERDYQIIKNGIMLEKFKFQSEVRKSLRLKYGWEQKKVILNVGRLSIPKNHFFMLDVFYELHTREKKSVLVCIGEGELHQKIVDRIHILGLEDSVCLLGEIHDVAQFYNAADVFLFPSLWEGLPIALLEAQANGLPIVASDAISALAKATESAKFLPLSIDASKWAEEVLKGIKKGRDNNAYRQVALAGWDMQEVSMQLRSIIGL